MAEQSVRFTAVILSLLMVLSMVAFGGTAIAADGDEPGVDVEVFDAGESLGDAPAAVSGVDEPLPGAIDRPESHAADDERGDVSVEGGEVEPHPGLEDADGIEDVLLLVERPEVAATGDVLERELKRQAEATQEPVVRELRAFEGAEVTNQFWVGNVVSATVDFDAHDVEELATVPGVEGVYPGFEFEHPEPPSPHDLDVSVEGELGADAGPSTVAEPETSGEFTYGLAQIDVPGFWEEFDTRGEGASVAIIDDGLDPDHPDLDVERGIVADDAGDIVGDEDDIERNDAHGDHVAGTATGAADPYGDVPTYGVAPDADLLKADVATEAGLHVNAILASIEWAVEEDADVASMSLGITDLESLYHEVFTPVIEDAVDAGTIVVSSSGNEYEGIAGAPATDFNVLSVGASDENRDIAAFSSGDVIADGDVLVADEDGMLAGDELPDHFPREYVVPSVSAPGDAVLSAGPIGTEQFEDGMYSTTQGTSMAAPHVAGAVGLLQSATDERLGPADIESALTETAEKPGDWDEDDAAGAIGEYDTRYGTGIINVTAAGLALEETTPVEGTVTDAETGDPVAGATVETDAGALTATDEDGAYAITVTTDGAELTVDAFGYESQSTSIDTGSGVADVDFEVGADVSDLEADVAGDDASVPAYPLGDVGETGEVEFLDVTDLNRHVLGLASTQPTFNETLADVDRDGDVDAQDVALAYERTLGTADEKHLTVVDQEVDGDVRPGETVAVTAEIENEGEVGAIEEVDLAVGSDGDLATVETTVVDVGGAATDENATEVTFELVIDLAPGEYTYAVVTEDHESTDTMTVGAKSFDAALEPTLDVEIGGEAPYYAAFDGDFEIPVEIANLEEYTAHLTDDSDVDDDDLALTVDDGDDEREAAVGETIEFDGYVGNVEITVDVDADADEGDGFALEHAFAGVGEEVEVTTRETSLTEQVDSAQVELSDIESESVVMHEGGEAVSSFNMTNTGQEPSDGWEIAYYPDSDGLSFDSAVVPLVHQPDLEPGETQRLTVTTGASVFTNFGSGQLINNRFEARDGPIIVGDEISDVVPAQAPGTRFDVVDLDGTERAEPGEAVDLTATIDNIGAEAAEQDVELHVDGDTVATESISLEAFSAEGADRESVTFEDVELPDADGVYEWGVSTDDASDSQEIGVGVSDHRVWDVTVVQDGDVLGELTADWFQRNGPLDAQFDNLVAVDSADVDEETVHETDVFVFHDVDDHDLIETVESDATTGAVYLEGAEVYVDGSNALSQREDAIGDPEGVDTVTGAHGTSFVPEHPIYQIEEDHPIFEGVGEVGDTVEMIDEALALSQQIWFEDTRGDVLATESVDDEPAAAVDTETGSVLLTVAISENFGPGALTDDAAQILANAIEFAEGERSGPPGSISGVVSDEETGDPVANATVAVQNEHEIRETTTDEDGGYWFSITESFGHHTVYVTDAPDGYATEAVVSVEPGDDVEADLTMDPEDPTITGTVVDEETGDPVANATVYDGDPGTDYFATETDDDGSFEIEIDEVDGIDRGDPVDVRSDHDDYHASGPSYVDIGPGENAVEIDLEPIVEGAVTVEDATYQNETDAIEVASATATADFVVVLTDGNGDVIGWSDDVDADDELTNLEVELDSPLESTTNVTATLHYAVEDDDFGDAIVDDSEEEVVSDTGEIENAAEDAAVSLLDRAADSGTGAEIGTVGSYSR